MIGPLLSLTFRLTQAPSAVGQVPVFYNYKPSSRAPYVNLRPNKPLYAFGFGLSYANFSYANLAVSPSQVSLVGVCSGGLLVVWLLSPLA